MSVRGTVLVGGWLLGVCLATAVSWAGVRLVGDEVAPTGAGSLSQAEVERRIHDTGAAAATSPGPSPGGLSTPPAEASPASSPVSSLAASLAASPAASPIASSASASVPRLATSRKSVASTGGTVVIECAGLTITARFSPASGFAGEQESAGASRVEVTFRSATHRSKVEGTCREGMIATTVEESGDGEDG